MDTKSKLVLELIVAQKGGLTDRRRHRLITLVMLVIALVLHRLAAIGALGPALQQHSWLYLGFMLLVLSGRALLTELGIRRRLRVRRDSGDGHG